MYVTGPNGFAWALDARTGRPFWRYRRELPNNLTYGASAPVNRGFAVLRDRLFMTTLDAHLVSLDMKTGTVLWDIEMADYKTRVRRRRSPPSSSKRQGHRRHLRERLSDTRISGRLQPDRRDPRLAPVYSAAPRRARQRDVAELRGNVRTRRWRDVGHRQLRSRVEHAVLGNRAIRIPITTATTGRATTCTPAPSSPLTRRRAS